MSDEKIKYADLLQLNKDSVWFTENALWKPKNGQVVHLKGTGTYKVGDDVSTLISLPFFPLGVSSVSWGSIIGSLSSQTDLTSYIASNTINFSSVLTGLSITGGTVNSTDSLLNAIGKLQNQINSVASPMVYQGTWNANTNVPTLLSGTGTKGYVYRVTTSGTTNLDSITDWKAGDFVVFNGTTWDKWDSTDAVTAVNGYSGNVNLIASDLVLTGYVSGAGTISPSDTVLQAIQKLDGNIAATTSNLTNTYVGFGSSSNLLSGSSKFTWDDTNQILKTGSQASLGNGFGLQLLPFSGANKTINTKIATTNDGVELRWGTYPMLTFDSVGNIIIDCSNTTIISRGGAAAIIVNNSGNTDLMQNLRIAGNVAVKNGGNPASPLTVTGNAYFGTNSASTARVHIAAGTATAGTAPLKLTSGTLLATIAGSVENGAIEYDGTDLSMIIGSTRHKVAFLSKGGNFTSNVGMSAGFGVQTVDMSITDVNVVLSSITGTKWGTATTHKQGWYNATPVIQQTTGITASTFAANTSGIVNDSATFGGYTIGQIVAALKLYGFLA